MLTSGLGGGVTQCLHEAADSKIRIWMFESFLTDNIEQVGVSEAAVFVLHHAGVVPSVRGNHRLHDQGPHVLSDLRREEKVR